MDTPFGGGTEKSISTAYTKYAKFILFLEWECDYNNTVKKSKHRAAVRPDISIGVLQIKVNSKNKKVPQNLRD